MEENSTFDYHAPETTHPHPIASLQLHVSDHLHLSNCVARTPSAHLRRLGRPLHEPPVGDGSPVDRGGRVYGSLHQVVRRPGHSVVDDRAGIGRRSPCDGRRASGSWPLTG